jgi:hypothetical protein
MDEMVVAAVGAAAAVTLLGRGVRPMGKVLMRGVVAATEATEAGRRGVEGLYNEVKAERRSGAAPAAGAVTADQSVTAATSPATAAG